MILSRHNLKNIHIEKLSVPHEALFDLPEKVLQFGTGVLLRGLPDYFIDKANKQGLFNGRIVVVKSTAQGDSSSFDKQDGLYTICVRGLANGEEAEEYIINASISRVLNAQSDWAQILACAHNSEMQVIISNTTEVGIQLVTDDIRQHPPLSYPGKLLAFLHERFNAFGGSEVSGMVIVPTELIPDNGKKLQSIVLELAQLNGFEDDFINWLRDCNFFCNSLVDRIVPGKPDAALAKELENSLGYEDSLMIVTEVYRLWAIEGDAHITSILSFCTADEGVVIESNIELYRELKLRLLNGTHTLCCGLALLAGFSTVKDAMDDEVFSNFMEHLMQNEIASSIPYEISLQKKQSFSTQVLDRFRNPYLKHLWLNITMQYSSKMKLRCIPLLLNHYKQTGKVPDGFALGFAAYLYFMKAVVIKEDQFYGEANAASYIIRDEMAETFYNRWRNLSTGALVNEVLSDAAFWGEDLHNLPGFSEAVTGHLNFIINSGVMEALKAAHLKTRQ